MLTSIIILVHNKLPLTRKCIESIRQCTPPLNYELIVVDNASTDGTAEWLKQQQDIRLLLNPENVGFPQGCNQGLKIAAGENLLLLNNDTIVTPRWLEQLLTCLHSDKQIGAVGPVTNSASYYTSLPVSYQTEEEMTSFAQSFNRSDPSKWEERLKLVGYCLLFKREVYDIVGELDERFSPGNYEDDDYCLRIREAGYRLLLCSDTFIHHEGSASFLQDIGAFAHILETNAEKFKHKWGFDPNGSFAIHHDLLEWIQEPEDSHLRLLEDGCACGATLLEFKSRFPNAHAVGHERNPAAARIASFVADVHVGHIETMDLNEQQEPFDYILLGDALSYKYDPEKTLSLITGLLKPNGALLATVPNLAHYSLLRGLLRGDWPFTSGSSPLRFYTLESVSRLLQGAGFSSIEIRNVVTAPFPRDEHWMDEIARITGESMKKQWVTNHYLVKASRPVS